MKMKYSSTPTPKCHHLHLVYRGDAPGSPGPSCRSLLLYAHYSCTPHSVAYRPKVLTPVTLAQIREFLLQMVRCPSFQFLHQQTYALMRRILYVHVDMILAHHSFQYMYILTVTYLYQQFPAPLLDVSL